MSMALETRVKELKELVHSLAAKIDSVQKQEDLEARVKALENKLTMLNARMARGKTD